MNRAILIILTILVAMPALACESYEVYNPDSRECEVLTRHACDRPGSYVRDHRWFRDACEKLRESEK